MPETVWHDERWQASDSMDSVEPRLPRNDGSVEDDQHGLLSKGQQKRERHKRKATPLTGSMSCTYLVQVHGTSILI